ncbi:MAG TPA: pyruvate formate lyase family protein, partial [Bacillota bacterium]|nr:pyruvate formate lyase family protein [Bacillota bacterium]
MTDRVKRLREISVSTQPSISMERARLFTEAYKKWEGTVSVPEMRALALRYFMENRSLYIERGELIVGEKGERP